MNDGRLVAVGTPRELYEDCVDPFVADFFGDINILPGTVRDSRSIRIDGEAGLMAAGHRAALGTTVRLAVRPEKMSIAKPGELRRDWNEVGGRVEEVIYVAQLNDWDMSPFDVGAAVTVSWRAPCPPPRDAASMRGSRRRHPRLWRA
jgi:ABC-type Fe3+/spermidine/putrescine transport system ATPase subunit